MFTALLIFVCLTIPLYLGLFLTIQAVCVAGLLVVSACDMAKTHSEKPAVGLNDETP